MDRHTERQTGRRGRKELCSSVFEVERCALSPCLVSVSGFSNPFRDCVCHKFTSSHLAVHLCSCARITYSLCQTKASLSQAPIFQELGRRHAFHIDCHFFWVNPPVFIGNFYKDEWLILSAFGWPAGCYPCSKTWTWLKVELLRIISTGFYYTILTYWSNLFSFTTSTSYRLAQG